jgi:tRNA(Ile)-lysidine synthase
VLLKTVIECGVGAAPSQHQCAASLYSTGMLAINMNPPLAVAYSGGADSTALLLQCARQYPGQVQAIHIHHGLQAAADDFVAHCTAFCAALGVPLHVVHVQARGAPGDSPEDAARKARYSALVGKILEINQAVVQVSSAQAAIKTIVVAQHADDQIETLLLALSRGAGLPGLSAMPAQWERSGITLVRPWLQVPAHEILAWLAAQGLSARHPGSADFAHTVGQGWIEDPTNTDQQFTRNRIRHTLLPALHTAFPQFRDTFARSARHAAQAQVLLAQLATEDIAATGNPPCISALQNLTSERQANLLRHWLKTTHSVAPSAAQLDELQSQIAACTNRGKHIRIKVASGFVERAGEMIEYLPSVGSAAQL